MSIREYLEENRENHKTNKSLVDACAEALDVRARTVQQKMSKFKLGVKNNDQTKAYSGPKKGNRTEEFRKRFDKSFRIPKEVEKQVGGWLSEDDVQWCTDAELQQRCGIKNIVDWKKYARENPRFDHLIFEADKRIIWAYCEEKRNELLRMSLS